MPTVPTAPCGLWLDMETFSGDGADLGVGDYLQTLGFVPSQVSFLITCPDFVHEHDGAIDDTPLRWEYSSYGGWKSGRRWTRRMFKHLVAQLQSCGIKVYLSVMANAYHPQFEMRSPWSEDHDELMLIHNTGLKSFTKEGRFSGLCFYNIAARFKDGTFYDAYFAQQAKRAVADFGCDGFHAGDGYKSFVLGIMAAGFSPDMLEQFSQHSGLEVPSLGAGEFTQTIPPVAQWIWENHRQAWIEFWRWRLRQSWTKVVQALKSIGKEFVINSAWSTDPLESITRYGIDTATLADASADVYFETLDVYTAIGPLCGPKSQSRDGYCLSGSHFFFSATLAEILRGTHAPKSRIYPMIHVQDAFERFELLKSGRTMLERAIIGHQHLYRVRQGQLERVTDKIWPAVASDVSAEDWKFVRTANELATSLRATKIPGPVALWSSSTIDAEIPTSRERWSVHRSLYEFAAAGCPVVTGADIAELPNLQGQCCLWANPRSFTSAEQQAVWNAAKNLDLIVFDPSHAISVPAEASAEILKDAHSGAELAIIQTPEQAKPTAAWLWREAKFMQSIGLFSDVAQHGQAIIVTPAVAAEPYEYREDMEPHYMTRVPPTRVSAAYLTLAAGIARRVGWPLLEVVRLIDGPRAGELPAEQASAFYLIGEDDTIYCIANNFETFSTYLGLTWAHPVARSRQLNSVLFHPEPQDQTTELMVGAGAVVVCELKLADHARAEQVVQPSVTSSTE